MQERHNPDLDCPLDEQLDAFVLLDTEVQSPADLDLARQWQWQDQHVSDIDAVLFVVAQKLGSPQGLAKPRCAQRFSCTSSAELGRVSIDA